MHMRPLPELLGLIDAAGFEIRDVQALREHYVRTVEAWHAGVRAALGRGGARSSDSSRRGSGGCISSAAR